MLAEGKMDDRPKRDDDRRFNKELTGKERKKGNYSAMKKYLHPS